MTFKYESGKKITMPFVFLYLLLISACTIPETETTPDSPELTGHFQTPELETAPKETNRLQHQEELLAKQRKEQNKEKEESDDKDPICRRFPGCIQLCASMDIPDCTWQTARQAAVLWSESIQTADEELIIHNIEWIYKNPHAVFFLYETDPGQTAMAQLFTKLAEAQCPLLESQDIFYEEDDEDQYSLYLAHPEGVSQGVKRIIDPAVYPFQLPLFKGLLSRCFNNKTQNVFEWAFTHSNWRGFSSALKLLHLSCGANTECTRLAYCKLHPDILTALKERPLFHPSAQQCEFDSFQSLPKQEIARQSF